MRLAVAISFLLFSGSASAQALSVCEVLSKLNELNGKKIVVRGNWIAGDAVRVLRAESPCERPMIRDGWHWTDTINLIPEHGKLSIAEYVAENRRLRKANPGAKILVTLTGQFETRERYDVRVTPFGEQLPIGFEWSAAQLRFVTAEDFKAVRFPEDLEESGRDYHPKRVPQSKPVP